VRKPSLPGSYNSGLVTYFNVFKENVYFQEAEQLATLVISVVYHMTKPEIGRKTESQMAYHTPHTVAVMF
jgi:hypothetical protein